MKQQALLIAALLFLCSCRNDLEVYSEDYKETAVVYGLIDKGQTQQFIRVNKTYRTAGSAAEGLQIKDSLCFSNIEVWLTATSAKNRVKLAPIAGTRKPEIFVLDNTAFPLSDSLRLEIINLDNGDYFTSVTKAIDPPVLSLTGSLISYGTNNTSFLPSPQGYAYDLYVRLSYDELSGSGTIRKYADYYIGKNLEVNNPASSGKIQQVFNGADMMYDLKQAMGTGSGTSRKLHHMNVIITAASLELKNYIQQFVPSKTIVQKTTQFSNITNGLGIFSTRATDISVNMQPDSSLRKLFKNVLNLD